MPTALLTGATGLIGGELCRLLLKSGWNVIALVRSDASVLGNSGEVIVSDALARLSGDISQSHCGLDPAAQTRLNKQADIVIHCAASTAFNASDDYYARTNSGGTANVLALAPDKPFLHISTAYVCGARDGPIAEATCPDDTVFGNGYEKSKAAAEKLVEQSGRPFLIARPSIVVGAENDGRIRRFDAIYGTFKLLAEGHVRSVPATSGASFNFVPIDYVAEALLALANHHSRFAGQHVHLCARDALTIADFIGAIAGYPGFAVPAFVDPSRFRTAKLPRRERLVFDQLFRHYLPYFQRNPDFQHGEITKMTGLKSPVFDLAVMARLVRFAVDAGYLIPAVSAAEMAGSSEYQGNGRQVVRARPSPTSGRLSGKSSLRASGPMP